LGRCGGWGKLGHVSFDQFTLVSRDQSGPVAWGLPRSKFTVSSRKRVGPSLPATRASAASPEPMLSWSVAAAGKRSISQPGGCRLREPRSARTTAHSEIRAARRAERMAHPRTSNTPPEMIRPIRPGSEQRFCLGAGHCDVAGSSRRPCDRTIPFNATVPYYGLSKTLTSGSRGFARISSFRQPPINSVCDKHRVNPSIGAGIAIISARFRDYWPARQWQGAAAGQ